LAGGTWISLGAAPLLLGIFRHTSCAEPQERLAAAAAGALLQRTFAAGIVTQVVLWCGQASFFLVLALYLQQGRGLGALRRAWSSRSRGRVPARLAARPCLRYGHRLITVGALTLAGGHLLLLASVTLIGTGGSIGLLVPIRHNGVEPPALPSPRPMAKRSFDTLQGGAGVGEEEAVRPCRRRPPCHRRRQRTEDVDVLLWVPFRLRAADDLTVGPTWTYCLPRSAGA
jgi:hypothetical protein